MTMSDSNPTAEGRSRIFYVGRREFFRVFTSLTRGEGNPVVSRLVGLPADAYICAVDYDFQRACFCIRVDSKEFSPVPVGNLIPEIPVIIETKETVNFREFT